MTTLYRAFDEQGRLLYVGISDNEFLRLGQHEQSSLWAFYAVTITLERYMNRDDAEAAEAEAIRTEDPVWNVDGRPTKRFLQWMRAYPHGDPDKVELPDLARLLRWDGTTVAREELREREETAP